MCCFAAEVANAYVCLLLHMFAYLPAGQGHPMKPHRVRMANSLVLHYGLHSKLDGVGGGKRMAGRGGAGYICRLLRLIQPALLLLLLLLLRAQFPMPMSRATSLQPLPHALVAWAVLRSHTHLQYYTPTRAGPEDMTAFHAEDYVDFLRTVTPDNMVGLFLQTPPCACLSAGSACWCTTFIWPICLLFPTAEPVHAGAARVQHVRGLPCV